MAPDLEPGLGGDALPDPFAPGLGGVRGQPAWLVELVREAIATQGLARAGDRAGRRYAIVLAMLEAETGLARPTLEALIAHLFPG